MIHDIEESARLTEVYENQTPDYHINTEIDNLPDHMSTLIVISAGTVDLYTGFDFDDDSDFLDGLNITGDNLDTLVETNTIDLDDLFVKFIR
jgi:hypothetical protein